MNDACPVLFVVCGKPGVGKTTYGMKLAKQANAVFLDIDTVTEPVVKAGLALAGLDTDDRDSAQFKKAFREPVYQALFDTAKQNLSIRSVVITGPFSKEISDPQWHVTLTRQFGCRVEIHFLHCSELNRLKRIRERENPRDLAKLTHWQENESYYGDIPAPACQHIFINTD